MANVARVFIGQGTQYNRHWQLLIAEIYYYK